MNKPIPMNTNPYRDLESGMASQLRLILEAVPWLGDPCVKNVGDIPGKGFDLEATLPLPKGGFAALCVECKNELPPSAFLRLVDRAFAPEGKPERVIKALALPMVSPRIAELCALHGWSWFDLAGNHVIDVPGLLHLSHTGSRLDFKRPRPLANLSTPEAGRVVRALLTPFYAGHRWTQRSMQMHCNPNVSLGLVNKVVKFLRDEAFVETLDGEGFRLVDPVKLLFAWRDAYRFQQHQRQGYFTLLQGVKLREALATLSAYSGGFAAYAAFSAADFQAPNVRQPKTWLFVARRELDRFAELTEAKPVDSGENLVVLVPSDDGVFFHADGGATHEAPRLPCTNQVQTYVDLWHCGGRGREAAEALLEQQLKPLWKASGLKI